MVAVVWPRIPMPIASRAMQHRAVSAGPAHDGTTTADRSREQCSLGTMVRIPLDHAEWQTMRQGHFEELARKDRSYWWFRTRYRTVVRLLKTHHVQAFSRGLMDYGCGTGGFLEHVTSSGFVDRAHAIGVDADAGVMRSLSVRGLQGLHSAAESLADLQLPFPPDVITMLDVLEHLDDPAGVLASLGDKVNRPATLVVLVPAMQSLWSEWDERLAHRRRYDRGTLAAHLRDGGWQTVSMQYLFPSMVIPATLRRRLGIAAGSDDFPEIDRRLNWLLGWCTALESRFPWWPCGTSLAAVARRR